MKGFQANGLWPLDITVFSDADFATSPFTDINPSNRGQSSEIIGEMTKLSSTKSSVKSSLCHVYV